MRNTLTSLVLSIVAVAAASAEPWKVEVLMESEHGMGGAAIGDLDPSTPGAEVAVVNDAAEAWLVRRADGKWQPERIYAGNGEMIMCAIGDVDPRNPGNEFVGVGMVEGAESSRGPGQAVLVWKDGERWSSRVIFQDTHLLHGVAIGDVSAAHPGNEVVVCGFNHRVQLLYLEEGSWKHETIYVANDRLKIVLAADVLPDRPGLEVVATGSDGRPQLLWEGKLGWHHQTVFADRIGQSRVAVGEAGILIGGDGGKVTLARRHEGRWQAEFLGRDTAKIRGVVLADVESGVPGSEAYACGYSGRVTQFVRTTDAYWESHVVHAEDRPLHHLLAGEFDSEHAGVELLTCGHGGRLIAVYPTRQSRRGQPPR
jgi:hypothetical protein